jgi:anti-anti-sigma factor
MVPIVFLSVTVSPRAPVAFARRGPPEVVVCLRGEHDLSTVHELSATMARAMALGDADLVVDLSRVGFMGASTVGVLARARELLRVRSRSLVVRSPSWCARRVLEACDLGGLIDRGVDVSLLDRAPKTVVVRRIGPRHEVSSGGFHRRADEQEPARMAGQV